MRIFSVLHHCEYLGLYEIYKLNMKIEIILSIIAIVVAFVIGCLQIYFSIKQNNMKKKISIIENQIQKNGSENSFGINNNSNNGNISNNKIKNK